MNELVLFILIYSCVVCQCKDNKKAVIDCGIAYHYQSGYNQSCIWLVDFPRQRATWNQARLLCRSFGVGDLIMLDGKEKLQTVINRAKVSPISADRLWLLGYSRQAEESREILPSLRSTAGSNRRCAAYAVNTQSVTAVSCTSNLTGVVCEAVATAVHSNSLLRKVHAKLKPGDSDPSCDSNKGCREYCTQLLNNKTICSCRKGYFTEEAHKSCSHNRENNAAKEEKRFFLKEFAGLLVVVALCVMTCGVVSMFVAKAPSDSASNPGSNEDASDHSKRGKEKNKVELDSFQSFKLTVVPYRNHKKLSAISEATGESESI